MEIKFLNGNWLKELKKITNNAEKSLPKTLVYRITMLALIVLIKHSI